MSFSFSSCLLSADEMKGCFAQLIQSDMRDQTRHAEGRRQFGNRVQLSERHVHRLQHRAGVAPEVLKGTIRTLETRVAKANDRSTTSTTISCCTDCAQYFVVCVGAKVGLLCAMNVALRTSDCHASTMTDGWVGTRQFGRCTTVEMGT